MSSGAQVRLVFSDLPAENLFNDPDEFPLTVSLPYYGSPSFPLLWCHPPPLFSFSGNFTLQPFVYAFHSSLNCDHPALLRGCAVSYIVEYTPVHFVFIDSSKYEGGMECAAISENGVFQLRAKGHCRRNNMVSQVLHNVWRNVILSDLKSALDILLHLSSPEPLICHILHRFSWMHADNNIFGEITLRWFLESLQDNKKTEHMAKVCL